MTAMAPPLSWTPAKCSSALDLYNDAAALGTAACNPPRLMTPEAKGVWLEKLSTALPGVEDGLSERETPVRAEFTVAPATVSNAELYCNVNRPEVTPVPLLRLIGMPALKLAGRSIAWEPAGPRAKLGMPITVGGAPTTKVVV